MTEGAGRFVRGLCSTLGRFPLCAAYKMYFFLKKISHEKSCKQEEYSEESAKTFKEY